MKSTLYKTRNDLRERVRRSMIDLLNRTLADILNLGFQAKQAHWNVKGPNFIGLHELFDKVAEELEEHSDEIAERAVALGGEALGTVEVVARKTRLPAYPLGLASGRGHVVALSTSLAAFAKNARGSIETATKAGDADTADLLTDVSRAVDKLLWMVEAHGQSRD